MPERTLILLRHAKSDWRTGNDDHERPLNARGQRAAALMGVYLSQQGLAPDLVISSSAIRARETAEHVLHHAGYPTRPVVDRGLYMADPERILAVIRRQDDGRRCLLVVGHNPGMGALVAGLARNAEDVVRGAAEAEFATATLAVGVTDAPWAEAGPETVTLIEVTAPKALV